jgi:hypothetical protein
MNTGWRTYFPWFVTGASTVSGGGGETPDFVPTDIDGLTLWLDADDESTITLDGSSNVSLWEDKSGNNRDYYQNTVMARPDVITTFLTDKRAVRINGASKALESSATWNALGNNTAKTITEFYVIKCSSTNGTAFIRESTTGHKIYAHYSGSVGYYDCGPESTARINGSTTGTNITTGQIITAQRNGANMSLEYGETLVASRADASGDIYTSISAGVFLQGPDAGETALGEILIYNAALTSGEIDTVRAYLKTKWGTP